MLTFPHFVEIFIECAGFCDLGQFKHYAISEMKTSIRLLLNLMMPSVVGTFQNKVKTYFGFVTGYEIAMFVHITKL